MFSKSLGRFVEVVTNKVLIKWEDEQGIFQVDLVDKEDLIVDPLEPQFDFNTIPEKWREFFKRRGIIFIKEE